LRRDEEAAHPIAAASTAQGALVRRGAGPVAAGPSPTLTGSRFSSAATRVTQARTSTGTGEGGDRIRDRRPRSGHCLEQINRRERDPIQAARPSGIR